MKERPILFSGPMVRAILEGRKTQTRRIMKPQPHTVDNDGRWYKITGGSSLNCFDCPYGQPGDRLWLKEAFRTYSSLNHLPPRGIGFGAGIQYEAGGSNVRGHPTLLDMGRYRHARFMPRWASRITLEVTGVRVERLHDISEEDAIAEGCQNAEEEYVGLWESINGPGSWNTNPWVWVIEFRKLTEA